MKRRSSFDENRDQQIADKEDAPKGYTHDQMCGASGCPNRWTVDSNDKGLNRLCSAHAWAEPNRWPEITQQQQWDETERARLFAEPSRTGAPLTLQEKREIIKRMQPALDKLRMKSIQP